MTLAQVSMLLSTLGVVCSVALLEYAAEWRLDSALVATWLWISIPYVACFAIARAVRSEKRPGVAALIAVVAAMIIGIGWPAKILFIDRPDGQSAFQLLLTPLIQALVCSPFLVVAVVAFARQRTSGRREPS